MEQFDRLWDSINMIDRRVTAHEAECKVLRGEIKDFMATVRLLIRWVVVGIISGFGSLIVWLLKQTVHVHVGLSDLTHLWITNS